MKYINYYDQYTFPYSFRHMTRKWSGKYKRDKRQKFHIDLTKMFSIVFNAFCIPPWTMNIEHWTFSSKALWKLNIFISRCFASASSFFIVDVWRVLYYLMALFQQCQYVNTWKCRKVDAWNASLWKYLTNLNENVSTTSWIDKKGETIFIKQRENPKRTERGRQKWINKHSTSKTAYY